MKFGDEAIKDLKKGTELKTLDEEIEEWREVVRNHIRNIDDLTKVHIIDKIDCVEDDVKKAIKDILGEFRRRFYGSNITTKDYDEFLEFVEQRVGRKLIK